MIIVISPAKSLDLETKFDVADFSLPEFNNEILEIRKNIAKLSAFDLEKMMKISPKLSELNFSRFQNFEEKFTLDNSRQALLAFDGDVYKSIEKKNYDKEDFAFSQKHLRILSGLYGLLKPLDLIQPYRLEMGTDFKKTQISNSLGKNLYEFWGEKITNLLNESEGDDLINLASSEYFSAIKPKNLKKNIINISFKENKNGVLKIIGISAKRARGLMVNYAIKNKLTKPQDLKQFSEQNYQFDTTLSDNNNYVFTR